MNENSRYYRRPMEKMIFIMRDVALFLFLSVMRQGYGKIDKLKSKKLIEALFREGDTISVFPLRLIYMPAIFHDGSRLKTGVSVSKKTFKKAVTRNHIKRLIREAYRLNKNNHFNNLTTSCALMILYIGKNEPSFGQIDKAMTSILSKLDDAMAPKT